MHLQKCQSPTGIGSVDRNLPVSNAILMWIYAESGKNGKNLQLFNIEISFDRRLTQLKRYKLSNLGSGQAPYSLFIRILSVNTFQL